MHKAQDVYLAPLSADDAPTLHAWINERAEVLRSSSYRPVAYPQHLAWMAGITGRTDATIFSIRRIVGDDLVGTCQLHSISAVDRCAELQIRLGAIAERGKGLGTQAVRLLLDYGFLDLNLQRIYLHVMATNLPAIRVYEKTGFLREGLLRRAAYVDGAYVDLAFMAILRDEYDAVRAKG
jgi:diamine N-acetyltransferase